VPYTSGFATAAKLTDHFTKHHALLGVATEADYLSKADTFMGAPLANGILECYRASDGDKLRFCPATQEYGVLRPDGVIRTYYMCNGVRPRRDARWFNSRCKS